MSHFTETASLIAETITSYERLVPTLQITIGKIGVQRKSVTLQCLNCEKQKEKNQELFLLSVKESQTTWCTWCRCEGRRLYFWGRPLRTRLNLRLIDNCLEHVQQLNHWSRTNMWDTPMLDHLPVVEACRWCLRTDKYIDFQFFWGIYCPNSPRTAHNTHIFSVPVDTSKVAEMVKVYSSRLTFVSQVESSLGH